MKPQKRTTRKEQLSPNPGKSQPTKKGHATKGVLKKCQSRGAGKSLANGGVADFEVKPSRPPKFSWVVEGVVAGHGRPTKLGHLQFLRNCNIHTIITLTENKPTILQLHPGGFHWEHIPVKDEKPPSQHQVQEFVRIVDRCRDNGQLVSVHCAWGRGRTGTLSACYLAHQDGLNADAAIEKIRLLRPGSIDTPDQEQVVRDYVAAPSGH